MRASVALVLLLSACSRPPRPAVLDEVERARVAPAAKEAERLAPQAFLAAERLAREAIRASDDGDRAAAQILAEQALAGYADAAALSRLARAGTRTTDATTQLAAAEKTLSALEAEQKSVAAEANDAELAYRVARDALPVAETEPASAEREQARLRAARSIALDARLLCVATQMLAPDTASLKAAFQSLDALEQELAKRPARAPIDAAVQLRTTCLGELSQVRRAAAAKEKESDGAPDALLDELGKAGLSPRRDDRGISVVLSGAFHGPELSPGARPRLVALGQVQKAHPAFPLLVVVHGGRGAPSAQDAARAEAVKKALVDAGAARVETRLSGDAAPIALPGRAAATAENERLELVFVAPTF